MDVLTLKAMTGGDHCLGEREKALVIERENWRARDTRDLFFE
jgi:hypothetical protein